MFSGIIRKIIPKLPVLSYLSWSRAPDKRGIDDNSKIIPISQQKLIM